MLIVRRTLSCEIWRREVLPSYTENGGNMYLTKFQEVLIRTHKVTLQNTILFHHGMCTLMQNTLPK